MPTALPSRLPPTILGTCCVPWNADYSLNEDLFRRSIRHLRDHVTRSLYLFGTAGEGHAVTDAQYLRLCRIFREEMSGPADRPMIGVISLSLGTIVERIEAARALGIRQFQLSLPSWGALNDRELRDFFAATCGRFPDCQFLHYNLMRAKRVVTPAEYVELAARHPNLVATKHGTNAAATIQGLMREAPMLTHFITEAGFAKACLLGESCGLLLSVSSTNLALARAYYAAGKARDEARLAADAAELATVVEILLKHAEGVAHMDGAFDKIYSRLHLPEFPLRLLPPYASYDEAAYAKIVAEIRQRAPRWLPAGV
ncbi:MAG: dihydrodipicolinate synthase family protein [Opitutaceae bacterium]|nr:dihydrodipicolinate synthase family protein [Opitutaceae bacterium]